VRSDRKFTREHSFGMDSGDRNSIAPTRMVNRGRQAFIPRTLSPSMSVTAQTRPSGAEIGAVVDVDRGSSRNNGISGSKASILLILTRTASKALHPRERPGIRQSDPYLEDSPASRTIDGDRSRNDACRKFFSQRNLRVSRWIRRGGVLTLGPSRLGWFLPLASNDADDRDGRIGPAR
jgi:hypothetical protein